MVIYDSFDQSYKKPFGAIESESECSFTLRFPLNTPINCCELIVYSQSSPEKIVIQMEKHETEKCIETRCSFTPKTPGLYFYYFSGTINGVHEYIKRKDANVGAFDGNELYQLTVYAKGMTTPDWLKGGIMYQIFPDRFAKSTESDIVPPTDRKMHIKWDEMPDWEPDANGQITNSDYFGGNLEGIREKLPYLKSLGVSVIYLTPIFEAHENHRYNTACYERIDPLLGSESDFVRLCESADKAGIKIILDGVFSHTGADSVYFNKFGRYGEKTGAFRDENSPYREWYSFINYPETYESWWGITTLPNVNENNPSYTDYICGNGGILQKWIDLGASGWRLDVADELPDDFLDNLRIAVKSKGNDKVIYGEVWEDASNKEAYGVRRRYLTGRQLDSVMNYPFKECILNYVKFGNAQSLKDGVMTIVEHYPKPCVDILMNFLSTHDTQRAITRLAGDDVGFNDRRWQSEHSLDNIQYVYGVALMKCAMVLQYFLPGIPCIYYGDEAGQQGYKDPFNRRTYPWEKQDANLIEYAAELGKIRRMSRVFEKGTVEFVEVTSKHCIFKRIDKEKGLGALIALNRSSEAVSLSLSELIGARADIKVARRSNESDKIYVSPFDYEVVFYSLS